MMEENMERTTAEEELAAEDISPAEGSPCNEEETAQMPSEGQAPKKDKKKRRDTQLGEIKAELEKERRQSQDYLNTAQRIQAEFDNFRRRNQTLRSDAYTDGKLDTLKEIIPVLDNFERALGVETEKNGFYEGVEKIYKQVLEVMTRMGVEEIPALGETFDPELHHAVMQAEATEEYPSGTVCEVFQKGYRAGGRILRYSMVKVAQ